MIDSIILMRTWTCWDNPRKAIAIFIEGEKLKSIRHDDVEVGFGLIMKHRWMRKRIVLNLNQ